ncbi:MAG: hypothetical protein ACR2QA_05910 [Solirubrobacteraceae bacterium]
MLSLVERGFAAIVAVGVGVLAYLAEVDPPIVKKAANSTACASPAAKACVVSVAADTSTVVVALIAIAAASALIAILGIRFTKVSAGGASLESDVTPTSLSAASKATGGALAVKRGVATATVSAEPGDAPRDAAFQRLPDWAKEKLIAWANTQDAVTRPIAYAVRAAAKEEGQGNKPWYVTVEQDSGDTLVLRVATGRGGTRIGEHDPA